MYMYRKCFPVFFKGKERINLCGGGGVSLLTVQILKIRTESTQNIGSTR